MLSMKDNDVLYIVNSEIRVCSCCISISSALCKHQEAVSIKFHISMFNFISLLIPDNCMIYSYIVLSK